MSYVDFGKRRVLFDTEFGVIRESLLLEQE